MGKLKNKFVALLGMLRVKQTKIFDFVIEHKMKPYKIHGMRNGKKIIILVLQLIKAWPCITFLTEIIKSPCERYRKNELITIRYHKLNRLLQLTRVVDFPALTGRHNVGVGL